MYETIYMDSNSLIINGIKKNYGSVAALKNICLSVNPGELFGLIGPDGAGKSTLFRILATLLLADEGQATLCGFDVRRDYKRIRELVGYMPGRFSLYQDLSVEENLHFFARVFGTTVDANYEQIRDIYVQIEPFRNRRAGKLSGGMKQKLALSCALIHKPRVLLLDEPTTGVDAVSRKEFWETLGRLRDQGITILVSTPYMDEASLCDRVALIQSGAILQTDTPQAIVARFDHTLFAVQSVNMYQLINDLRSYEGTQSAFLFGQQVHLTIRQVNEDQVYDYLKGLGHQNLNIKRISPSIEDCFMALMS